MKELLKPIYTALYEHLSLQNAGLIAGILLIVSHALVFVPSLNIAGRLKALPRSQNAGTTLLTIALFLAWMVASCMDLGEFYTLRWLAVYAVPVIYLLLLFVMKDFLGSRGLGILVLLAVCPLLNAAFLKDPASRVLLSLLCYIWLTFALFWVGLPHTLRDQIDWLTRTPGRLRAFAGTGIVSGLILVFAALSWWKGY